VGLVEEYYCKRTNGAKEGYVVIYFPHLQLRSKLLLSEERTWDRLRPLTNAGDVGYMLMILAGEPQRLPATWVQRKEMIQEKLKTLDLPAVAQVVRDLNALPKWGYLPSQTDFYALERARNILASEIQVTCELSWKEATLLLEKTVQDLSLRLPKKRGRKPRNWKPEDEIQFEERPGLLASNLIMAGIL
jgi:RNA polymerase-interacting CarD/CdnL/TRCF family regulator